jgi:hypothetical protein
LSTDCAKEKFCQAVDVLATSDRSIQERLAGRILHIYTGPHGAI